MDANDNQSRGNIADRAPSSVKEIMELPWILARCLNQFWQPEQGRYAMAHIPLSDEPVQKFRLLVDEQHRNMGLIVRYWLEGWLNMPTELELFGKDPAGPGKSDAAQCTLFMVDADGHHGPGKTLHRTPHGEMPTIVAVSPGRMGWRDENGGALYLLTAPPAEKWAPLEFVSRLAILVCFVFELACRRRPTDQSIVVRMTAALRHLPLLVASVLDLEGRIAAAAQDIIASGSPVLLGWGPSRAINREIKQQLSLLGITSEIADHLESAITPASPILCLAPDDAWHDTAMKTLQQFVTPSRKLLLLTGRPEALALQEPGQVVIGLPAADLMVQTIISAVVMQLFVCHVQAFLEGVPGQLR
ncbi:MAG: hypothetical protein HQL64_10290 [Magnetococcales bacterium]|nr:hypothetical protein [Magnetococcales bacterium]